MSGDPCPKCHQPHLDRDGKPSCTSHTKQSIREGTIKPCRLPPVRGATVCRVHGAGKGTPARRKADERLQQAKVLGQVAKAMAGTGRPPPTTVDALVYERGRAGRIADLLDQMVGELDLHPITARTDTGDDDGAASWTTLNQALYGPDWKGDGKPHILLALLGEWSDRHGKMAKAEIDVDIDTRRLQLESAEIARLESAFMAALAAANLDADQHNLILETFAGELRALNP